MNFSRSFHAAKAYGEVAVQSGVSEASPHKLVEMLFEGLIQSLNGARGAFARGDISEKGRLIGKSVRILEEGLKAGLNHENGGELAANLQSVYDFCILELTKANLHNNAESLDTVLKTIEPIASAWHEIADSGNRNI